jgi:hypothetical protein
MVTLSGDRIWVVVTGDCLHSIDRSSVPDQFAGTNIFARNRKLIEGAASVKFDNEGTNPADGTRQGCPVLVIRSDDIPDLETHH